MKFNIVFRILYLQFTLEGHAAEVYDIRLRKATNELLTTSEDKTAKIFKLDL